MKHQQQVLLQTALSHKVFWKQSTLKLRFCGRMQFTRLFRSCSIPISTTMDKWRSSLDVGALEQLWPGFLSMDPVS
ncbi:hypothetical protein TNCV_4251781 [Trichonephila clavipes]|nr:hypothetical protein TNCV_4251781 [Trichonephila clavipes]